MSAVTHVSVSHTIRQLLQVFELVVLWYKFSVDRFKEKSDAGGICLMLSYFRSDKMSEVEFYFSYTFIKHD